MVARQHAVITTGDLIAAMDRLTLAITTLDRNLHRLRAARQRDNGGRDFPDLGPERNLATTSRFIPDPPEAREFLPVKRRPREPDQH